MRPHGDDRSLNLEVGHAVRDTVNDMQRQQFIVTAIWYEVGRQINLSLQSAYDRGIREVQPSVN